MRAIFLSYRREDAEGEAGRLFDDLTSEFGSDKIFMDVAGIEPGRDFRKVIDQNVASCGVLLAMIGKGWIDAKDDSGRRRLDDPMDFVRLETASALKRDIPVIPVLVQRGRMPRAEQLPEDLKDLAYRNAVELTHARWDSDVQVLIKALRTYVTGEREEEGGTKTEPVLDRPLVTTRPPKKSWHSMLIVAVAAIGITVAAIVITWIVNRMYEYKKAEEAKGKSHAPDQQPSKSTDKTAGVEAPAAKDNVTPEGRGEAKPKPVPRLRVVDVSLVSSPQEFKGPCPATVSFQGKITVAGSPGQIRYQFVNEQGEATGQGSLQFDSVGTREVQTSRVIGTKGRAETYSGWEELRILSPQQYSARAPLRVECVFLRANQFRNFRRLDETGNRLSFTVDYSYSGDKGSEKIRAYGRPIQGDGQEVTGTTSSPAAVVEGQGTLTLWIGESARAHSSGRYESTEVRVCMDGTPVRSSSPGAAQPKAEPFYCENFPYQKTWVFVAPASATPAPSSGVAGAKEKKSKAPAPVSKRNSIRNLQVTGYRSDRVTLTVDYTYNGDHGSGGIYIVASPYQSDGSHVPVVSRLGHAQVGEGQGSMGLELLPSASGTYNVSRVDVCLQLGKSEQFHCETFYLDSPLRFGNP